MSVSFSDRELDVMALLWSRGSATVAEVQSALPDELAYTTVLTILRTLDAKGYVRHRKEGRAHRYFPAVPREEAGKSALHRLVEKIFDGSATALLTQTGLRSQPDQRGIETNPPHAQSAFAG